MADQTWVYVERSKGRVRRVTVLDDNLEVIAMHDRGSAGFSEEPDDCQLLRAVELERRAGLLAG
jgi:hypothetical protein